MTETCVKVRAQAHGGKYIGPNVKQAPVLSILSGGQPIHDAVTIPNNGSGVVVPQKSGVSSPYPIVVEPDPDHNPYYPTPGTDWLNPPGDGQAEVLVQLDLSEPTFVEFRVTAFSPRPVHGSVTMLLQPGQSYANDPGVVVPVKGLYVPPEDFTLTYDPASQSVAISATVMMLCGCPITPQPATQKPTVEDYWPSTEFEVSALFLTTQFPPIFRNIALTCKTTNQFTGTAQIPSGTYVVYLNAYQPSTMNSGGAAMEFTVP